MKKELIIKKCMSCGATVKVLEDCKCVGDCGIKCCGEKMKVLVANSVDAVVEKHVPVCEIKDGKLFVKVNHVMEEDHYIEWISIVSDKKEVTTYFKPGDEAVAHCKYFPGTTVYAYCNKHGLWKVDVE
ncbi:MAG: desulfoferrodoxin [Clostridia bacterium]|nr:desulfoferrodoxin [Clostridia bacterium]